MQSIPLENKKVNKKRLSVFAITMINIIAVDSLRTLPFSAAYGLSLVFYYLLAACVFFLPVAFISAELATGWPSRGGIYVWVREAFGERWGFVIIWLQWVYNIVWYPTILAFIAGMLAYLIQPSLVENKFFMLSAILSIFWGSTLLNLFGMRLSSFISTFGALFGTLVPMAVIMLLGMVWVAVGRPVQLSFDLNHFLPDLSNLDSLSFLLAVLFGLVGMEVSASHADEVENPGSVFPQAILFSTIIILLTQIFGSLAIAIVVPQASLNVVTGLIQAFGTFLGNYSLGWMMPLVAVLMIIGGIAGIATWIIGPTKGLLVAARDGCAPPLFANVNKHGAPTMILLLQGLICTILASIFLLMPNVSSSYWLLTAMTAQLAMLVYVAMFAAAIYLRYKKPDVHRSYKIPFGNIGIWVLGLLGMASCVGAITLGFMPPSQIDIGNWFTFEAILLGGIVALLVPPFIIYKCKKPEWKALIIVEEAVVVLDEAI